MNNSNIAYNMDEDQERYIRQLMVEQHRRNRIQSISKR